MNFTPLNVSMVIAGVILIYAAIRNVSPAVVVKNAVKGQPTLGGTTDGTNPNGPPAKKVPKQLPFGPYGPVYPNTSV